MLHALASYYCNKKAACSPQWMKNSHAQYMCTTLNRSTKVNVVYELYTHDIIFYHMNVHVIFGIATPKSSLSSGHRWM